MDPNSMDPNYPRKYPQDLPPWKRRFLWVVTVLSFACCVAVAWVYIAEPANIAFASLSIIAHFAVMTSALLALYPPASLQLMDFAKSCARLAFWIFPVGVFTSLLATVGERYFW